MGLTFESLGQTRWGGVWNAAMMAFAFVAALFCAFYAGAAFAQEKPDALSGAYIGLERAEGWRIELRNEGGSMVGAFTDRGGSVTQFQARGDEKLAETQIELAGRPVFFRFSPRPIGLVLFWIPVAQDGVLLVEEARSYAFLSEGVNVPAAPANVSPPPQGDQKVTALGFLNSYEFWSADEVGRGYKSLPDRHRVLIRLYAHVQTDILWKLCQSPTPPPGLAEALEGQVGCDHILEAVARAQRSGNFPRYKSDVGERKAVLIDAVRCAQGLLSAEQCVTVSRWTSQAAVSLETAESVLSRY